MSFLMNVCIYIYIGEGGTNVPIKEAKLNPIFMRDGVPFWVAASGYVILGLIAIGVIPLIFSALKWYHVLLCYIVAPLFAVCNAYGTGLTDWNNTATYAKLVLFILSAWVGTNGGVIAGLASFGIIMNIVWTAADLMQDLKAGHLTSSSPRSMFISQILGTALGCIIAPLTFWMFWNAFDIGNPDGQYLAPFAVIYREMSIIAVQGLSALPSHCLDLCYGFFSLALLLNVIRDMFPSNISRLIPIPMAMAIPFYIGANFTIDVFIGSMIVYVWESRNKIHVGKYVVALAAGLISGDGVWTIPSAVLSLCNVNPPICMSFAST